MDKWREVFRDKSFLFLISLVISIFISFKIIFAVYAIKPRKIYETLPRKHVAKVLYPKL